MPPGSKVGSIDQKIIITGATPHDIFEVLMDATQHAVLTGGEAKISHSVGGAFTTFDGWATGKHLELIPDKKIVQTWRAEDWPPGIMSTCAYELATVSEGTQITFKQTEVPKSLVTSVSKGWQQYYWKPMQKMFKKKG